jgi:hypothetical protein
MKLNDLVKLIVDNPNKKFVTDRELEQTVMFCCESIWAKEPLFRLEKFIKELCEIERPSRINRKSENGFKSWETEDIKPGRRYTKKDTEEVWIIGYRADADNYETRYVSVSENDGMVTTPPHTKEELAVILNEYGYVPMELL